MIKKVYIYILAFAVAFFQTVFVNAQCNDELVEKAITNSGMDALFIREFKIKQGEKKKRKKDKRAVPVSRFSVRLNSSIQYRFNVENDLQSQTRAILQLRKGNLVHASTYDVENQSDIGRFDFLCQEAGQYQVLLSFLDGNPGCAVGIMSVVVNDSTVTGGLLDSVHSQNILYAGTDNYVDIASSTNPKGTLNVAIDRGTINKEGGLYRIYVSDEGPVTIDVTAIDSLGQVSEKFKTEFNVQKRSLPGIKFLGSSGGIIHKEEIMTSMPYLSVENWRWSDSFKLKMFTVSNSLTSTGISNTSSSMMTSRQLNLIKELSSGDTFYIKDIVVEDKNGQVYNLPPLGFILSD
jgi:hypothetical protein